MGSNIPNEFGLGSISPNYYVNHEKFPDKILTMKSSYEIDKILDNDIETKISVYEDRINGWFLDFARKLTKETDSDFVVLTICMSYLEGNQQFREGKASQGESTEMLKRALKRIFPENSEDEITYLIDKVRHGLFHDGMTRRGALLRYGISRNIPFFFFIMGNERWVIIEPDLFLRRIETDFEDYIRTLKDKSNKKERENFEKYYNESYEQTPDI